MPHTYSQNVVHVVFSTKDRRKTISKELQPRMWSYVAGICKGEGVLVHAVGGMDDRIHLLVQVPPSLALAKAVLTFKSNSSRWANEPRPQIRMAARLRGIQRKRFPCSRSHSVHTNSRIAPQKKKNGLRYGTSCLVEKARRGIRPEIRFWFAPQPDFPSPSPHGLG